MSDQISVYSATDDSGIQYNACLLCCRRFTRLSQRVHTYIYERVFIMQVRTLTAPGSFRLRADWIAMATGSYFLFPSSPLYVSLSGGWFDMSRSLREPHHCAYTHILSHHTQPCSYAQHHKTIHSSTQLSHYKSLQLVHSLFNCPSTPSLHTHIHTHIHS